MQDHTATANAAQITGHAVTTAPAKSPTTATSSSVQSFSLFLENIDSLLESLSILEDTELMASIRQGMKEAAEGKGEDLDEVLAELGW
jgi:hypothetical protein